MYTAMLILTQRLSFEFIMFIAAVGGVWIWSLGVGIACLIGLIAGIAVEPYIISYVSVFLHLI